MPDTVLDAAIEQLAKHIHLPPQLDYLPIACLPERHESKVLSV